MYMMQIYNKMRPSVLFGAYFIQCRVQHVLLCKAFISHFFSCCMLVNYLDTLPVLVLVISRCLKTHEFLGIYHAEPHTSVGTVADLKTVGRWFDPRLGQYSFRGLMIVIATGFIPLSPLSVVSTMVMWESSLWLGKNIVRSTG